MAGRRGNFAEYAVRLLRLYLWMLLLPVAARAQKYPILPVANAPHGIYSLFEDNDSRLWLGTIDDVYCFDGVNFYSLRQYGFPRETPNAYAEDSEGGLWIATQGTAVAGGSTHGGLYRYRAGRVERRLSGDALSVSAPAPGVVLAAMGTEANLRPAYGDLYRFRLSGGRWDGEKLAAGIANHMTLDHGGNVLFPCPGGWCELTPEAVRTAKDGGQGLALQRHVGDPLAERILRDKFGCLWSRAEVRASYQCPGEAEPTRLPYELSQIDSSAQLQEGKDGSILMLVPMVLGRPGHFHSLGSVGLPPSMNSAILARDGTIWIAADGGLFRFPYPFEAEYWPQLAGEPSQPYMLRRIHDRIYSAFSRIAFLNQDHRGWTTIPGSDSFKRTMDLVGLPGGRILASAVEGLVLYQGDKGRVLARLPMQGGGGGLLAQTSGGEVYLGTKGIDRVVIHGDQILLQPEPVAREGIADMEYDRARDVLWACDGKQLLFHTDRSWHAITQADGLLGMNCGEIALQPDGQVWLGYAAAAFALIGDPMSGHPRVHNFTGRLDSLVGNSSVTKLVMDRRGRVWLCAGGLQVATAEAAGREAWIPLTEQDGIGVLSIERQEMVTDEDGSVWFLSSNGVNHWRLPDDFATNFPVPRVSIAGIAVGASAPQLADAVEKLPRGQEITAELGSVQFDRRNALHYRYRLLPEQSGWTQSAGTALHLGRVGWGKHRLQVQAQLSTGPWSEVSEESFTVLRPIWLTWPVLAGILVAGGSVAEGGRRWRKKRRERAKKAFPELAELRLSALTPELQMLTNKLLDGRYEVGKVLARGGFATVVEGRDLRAGGRACAIKIFRQELADKEWMSRRFGQEVLALEKVRHPNVVRIFGSGILPGGGLYLVMEFIDGVTLRELLEIGRLAPERVALYLRQAGSALEAIHAHGICHRDLKPENFMIRSGGEPGRELVMIDFSIAIVKDPDETLHGLSRAAGTIYYMAPEQAIGYADSSTDIYSLAKIVIEMLTGQRLSVLLPNASMDLPERVRELLQGLPVGLGSEAAELIGSALEFDPARRPRDARSFAETIAADLGRQRETV